MSKIVNLKCPNCGSNLKVNDSDKYLKCGHCDSNLLIEKDMDDEIKATINDNLKRNGKLARGILGYFFIAPIIGFVIFVIFAIGIFFIFNKGTKEISKSEFNFSFTYSNGTHFGAEVKDTLDEVISKNKKNKDHIITVIYNDIKTTDEYKIIEIKDKLKDMNDYEVIIDYDDKGFVNKVTILDK